MEPAFVQIGEDKVYETSLGGNVEIPIKVTRRGDFKEADQARPPSACPTDQAQGSQPRRRHERRQVRAAAQPAEHQARHLHVLYEGETKRKYVRNPDAVAAAEAEQKALDEMIAKLTEAAKTATTAKDTATKAAQDTAAAAKTAEQKKTEAANNVKAKTDAAKVAADELTKAKEAAADDTANQGLADAAKAAETASNDAAAAQKKAEEELAVADKALTDAQAAAKTAEEARVARKPLSRPHRQAHGGQPVQAAARPEGQPDQAGQSAARTSTSRSSQHADQAADRRHARSSSRAADPPAAVKQGEKQELTVKLERLYGFAERSSSPSSRRRACKGSSAQQGHIAQGPGRRQAGSHRCRQRHARRAHACIVRAKGRFNNVKSKRPPPSRSRSKARSGQVMWPHAPRAGPIRARSTLR